MRTSRDLALFRVGAKTFSEAFLDDCRVRYMYLYFIVCRSINIRYNHAGHLVDVSDAINMQQHQKTLLFFAISATN